MGVAMEWLGAAGCHSLAMQILTEPRARRSEIWAHCPFHAEGTPGGSFSYNSEKDLAKCQSCGAGGDLCSIWCVLNGYAADSPEGFRAFKARFGRDAPPAKRRPLDRPREVRRPLDPETRPEAPALWKERAQSFVFHAFERLMDLPAAIDELRRRWGITEATASAYGFGMNDKDKWVPVTSWGLPSERRENGKERTIWLPRGLVMPLMVGGEVRKIKIRRPDPSTPWGEPRRYWEVIGGENHRFHAYGPEDARIVVVIEAERDAALVAQECEGCNVAAVAGGGAAKRPHDPETIARIRRAEVLLVALDTDGAGATNAVRYWEETFGFAMYWPVPKASGKDVGEAWAAGMDVRAWVMAGVPEWMGRPDFVLRRA